MVDEQGLLMAGERRTNRRHEPRARKLSKTRSKRKNTQGADRLEAAQLSVGTFLRATRESQHLTQAQVAERTREFPWQLSRAAVSAIERGQNFPGLEAVLALSSVLQIDPKELIERARLTAVVPIDMTGLSDDDLEQRAGQLFWAGDFKRALSVYDAMVHKLALEGADRQETLSRLASLEVRRATTLKRIGALISAIASIERAISLATRLPAIQAEAYVVLADLQAQRGHLPLARDAAERAIELCAESNPTRLAWAYMVRGHAQFLAREFAEARESFLEASSQAEAHGDRLHQSHIAGNLGSCCLALGDAEEAERWIQRALALARQNAQPALEASWLVELGKLALARDEWREADDLARQALEIARCHEHHLTVFRAEWLRHRAAGRAESDESDAARLVVLAELFKQLDVHEGVDEIVEYRESRLRAREGK